MTSAPEKKQASLQEVDSQYLRRLETLAIFAGSIAHDYNNALTVILGNLSLARLEAQGNSELLDVIKDADSASVKVKKLTERLAGFARGIKSPKTIFSPADIINRAAEKVLSEYGGTFTVNIINEAPDIKGDKFLLEKVFENLFANASEASPESDGIITVTVEKALIEDCIYFHEIELNPGPYCLIKVSDNGAGITEGIEKYIFDPYYTTKEGRDGLGLALAYAVIKMHRGFVSAESGEGKGAVFKIFLPGE